MSEQQAVTLTPEFLSAARLEMAPKATDAQWLYFVETCKQRNLIPGRHVIFQTRKVSTFSKTAQDWVDEEKVVFITSIDAFRLIAERTGKYKGHKPFLFYYGDGEGNPTVISKIPLGKIPHAASVEILRKDFDEPMFAFARYDACVQRKKAKGSQTVGDPNQVWDKRGEEQLAKCAEVAGLRAAFPEETGNLYLAEEMPADENVQEAVLVQNRPTETKAPVEPPKPLVVPQVNSAPPPPEAQPVHVQTSPIPEVAQASAFPKELIPPSEPVAKLAVEASMGSFFEPELPAMPLATEPLPNVPSAAASASPSSTVASAEVPSSVPFTTATTSADPAASTGPATVYHAFTEKPSEAPKDEKPASTPAPSSTLTPAPETGIPDPTQYRALTGRISKIVRDVLQKNGVKDANAIILAFITKTTGQTDLKKVTTAQWDTMLKALEGAGNHQAVLKIVKG